MELQVAAPVLGHVRPTLVAALERRDARAIHDALHLDAVAFCRGYGRPVRTHHGADAVADLLTAMSARADAWTVSHFDGLGVVLRGVCGDQLVVSIDVRFEGERAAGMLLRVL